MINKPTIWALTLLTWLYCGAALFDPSDLVLGIKLPLFTVIMVLFIAAAWKGNITVPRDLAVRVLLLAVVMPGIALLVLTIHHPEQGLGPGLSLMKALWALMLALPVAAAGIDLKRPVFAGIAILSLGTVGLALLAAADPVLHQQVAGFLIDRSVALIGSRSFGGVDLAMILFVTAPLLVLPVPALAGTLLARGSGAAARVGAALFLILIIAAAYLSASRAIVAVLLLELVVCLLLAIGRRPLLMAAMLVLLAACAVLGVRQAHRTQLFSAGEQSNSVKISHAVSFVSYASHHPMVLITGDGLGATYFTNAPGIDQTVYQTELTYLDMIRYFGIIGSVCFLLLMVWPFFCPVTNTPLLVGFIAYLLVAGSNPLLFNSTGMLALVYFWSQQYCDRARQLPEATR